MCDDAVWQCALCSLGVCVCVCVAFFTLRYDEKCHMWHCVSLLSMYFKYLTHIYMYIYIVYLLLRRETRERTVAPDMNTSVVFCHAINLALLMFVRTYVPVCCCAAMFFSSIKTPFIPNLSTYIYTGYDVVYT